MSQSKFILAVLLCSSIVSPIAQAGEGGSPTHETHTLNLERDGFPISPTARVHFDTLQGATGLWSIFSAYQEFNLGRGDFGEALKGATGLGSVFGAVTFVSEAKGVAKPTRSDPVRRFRNSVQYKNLVRYLGSTQRAEEFTADMVAGWDADHLVKKYGRTQADRAKLYAFLDKHTL